MKLLFVCNMGMHRSRTAAELMEHHDTRYKGLYHNLLEEEDMEWADVVFVMTGDQRTEISQRFPKHYLQKQILCLEISDAYSYGQADLKELILERFRELEPQIEL